LKKPGLFLQTDKRICTQADNDQTKYADASHAPRNLNGREERKKYIEGIKSRKEEWKKQNSRQRLLKRH
jgi:hypothetical protein